MNRTARMRSRRAGRGADVDRRRTRGRAGAERRESRGMAVALHAARARSAWVARTWRRPTIRSGCCGIPPASRPWIRTSCASRNAHLFEETSINGFGFAVPGSWLPSFGVSMVSMGSGDFQRTNDMNDPLGTFKNGETAYLLTASKAFSPRLSIGTNFKFVQQTVEDFSAQGFGMDLGVLFDVTPTVRVGGSVANLAGPSLKLRDVAETYPVAFRGGVAAEMFNGRGLMSLELDQSSGLGAGFHAGAEYWLQPMIALRAGFDNSLRHRRAHRTASRRSTSSTTRSPISRSVSRIAWVSATASAASSPAQGGSGDLLADRREGGHARSRSTRGPRPSPIRGRSRSSTSRTRSSPLRGPGSAARARPVGRQGRDRHAAGRWHVPLPVDGQGPRGSQPDGGQPRARDLHHRARGQGAHHPGPGCQSGDPRSGESQVTKRIAAGALGACYPLLIRGWPCRSSPDRR